MCECGYVYISVIVKLKSLLYCILVQFMKMLLGYYYIQLIIDKGVNKD